MEKKFIKNVNTAEDVKEKYFKMVTKYHEDARKLAEINNEFDELMKQLKNVHYNHDTNTVYKCNYNDSVEHFKKVINKYSNLEGVNVKVNGCFIFITGEKTKEIKEDLKFDNFRWQNEKQRWYYSSRPYRTKEDYAEINARRQKQLATA